MSRIGSFCDENSYIGPLNLTAFETQFAIPSVKKKFITCTLPYVNAPRPHVGAAFEFVLADIIAEYWRTRIGSDNVRLNIGLDEHGQKIAQKAQEEGLTPQEYCDRTAKSWIESCDALGISYDVFYRTSDEQHKKNAVRLFGEDLKEFIYERDYEGLYCVGCESYKTQKEVVNGRCAIHGYELPLNRERIKCFDIQKFAPNIEDRLLDKTLSKELKNIIAADFDFPITRNNVEWAIPFEGSTLHVWPEALANYLFAAGLYSDPENFQEWWANSVQLCGKDNLKFQAYIFQAILLAKGLPQTKDILIHGTILDEKGNKMSKSLGNVVDPTVQLEKYGRGALRYYLALGLNTYDDTAFSERELVNIWNKEVVGGFGNLVARTLHLVDISGLEPTNFPRTAEDASQRVGRTLDLIKAFDTYDFHAIRQQLNEWVGYLNARINNERPFDEDAKDRKRIIFEIYTDLVGISKFYSIILRDERITKALEGRKKVILFEKLKADPIVD
jgi:methionyl-tRNA synthetase